MTTRLHRILLLAVLGALLVGVLSAAQAQTELLVTSSNSSQVLSYDGQTGTFLGVFATGPVPVGIATLNGSVWVTYMQWGSYMVRKYDSAGNVIHSVGVNQPYGVAADQAGNVYVGSIGDQCVYKYDGVNPGSLAPFVTNVDPRGIEWGPDNNLWVTDMISNSVKVFNGTTGALTTTISGVNVPTDLTFGPDGSAYIVSNPDSKIYKWDGTNLTQFASGLLTPNGITLGPDGNLYAGNRWGHNVVRYNINTGASMGEFVPYMSGGLNEPAELAFNTVPEPASIFGLLTGCAGVLAAYRRKRR